MKIEIYLAYSNKETVDCLVNNVIKLICVQFVNCMFIEFLIAFAFSFFDLHLQLLCK